MSDTNVLLCMIRKNFAPWALAVLVHGGLGLFTTMMLLAAESAPPAQNPGSNPNAPAQPAGTYTPTADNPAAADPSHGKDMTECMEIIRRAEAALTRLDHYTCQFLKREFLDGKLQPEHTIDMVVRHEPFSVALKWNKPRNMAGQEGMWIEGKHTGRMRVKGAGLLGAVGFLSLDLKDKRVASTSRHAITEAGIANIVRRLSKDWAGFEQHELDRVMLEDVTFDNRACRRIHITHPREQMPHFEFAKAVITFDKEHHLPIAIECYGWPQKEGEDPMLLESYQYPGLKLNPGVNAAIFER